MEIEMNMPFSSNSLSISTKHSLLVLFFSISPCKQSNFIACEKAMIILSKTKIYHSAVGPLLLHSANRICNILAKIHLSMIQLSLKERQN
jgi:hypothetical protein